MAISESYSATDSDEFPDDSGQDSSPINMWATSPLNKLTPGQIGYTVRWALGFIEKTPHAPYEKLIPYVCTSMTASPGKGGTHSLKIKRTGAGTSDYTVEICSPDYDEIGLPRSDHATFWDVADSTAELFPSSPEENIVQIGLESIVLCHKLKEKGRVLLRSNGHVGVAKKPQE